MTPLLEAGGVAVADRLEPTDLTCTGGELVAIIGPNGAGKTSLLRALAGIELTSGSVSVDNEDIIAAPPARRTRLLSFLPATRSLVWPIPAADVIALGLPSVDPERIGELVELLELQAFINRPANSLSTGERTRVLIARALAARPRLMLLDEPLSNLDPYWVLKALRILRDGVSSGDAVILASIHNFDQVTSFDRVVVVDRRRIIADGMPDEILASERLTEAFRVERIEGRWKMREEA